jgi:hypothetical protein
MFKAFVVAARVPKKMYHMFAKERVLCELFEFLQSLRTVGYYSSPDEMRRAYSMQVLTHETALRDSAAALRREKTEYVIIQLSR